MYGEIIHLFLHLGLDMGVKDNDQRPFDKGISGTPSCHVLSRSSPTSPKIEWLRCLPLKYWMASNTTSMFNRAAVLSRGLLMELQDWDQGQIVCEKNEGWRLLQ